MKKLGFRLKHKFFNAFREIFVHHHNSLEFRAKILALIIAADEHPKVDNYIIVKRIADEIYKDDEDRANLLLMRTKEIIEQIHVKKQYTVDALVDSIVKNLKKVPRYAKKIDVDQLEDFLHTTYDEDIILYRRNILEFLERLKEETLEKLK